MADDRASLLHLSSYVQEGREKHQYAKQTQKNTKDPSWRDEKYKILAFEMKNICNTVINGRLNTEKNIFVPENTEVEHPKESRETDWKMGKKINELWNNLKWLNTHVFGVPNIGSRKEQKLFEEIMAEVFQIKWKYRSKKHNKPYEGKTWRQLHRGTSQSNWQKPVKKILTVKEKQYLQRIKDKDKK